MSMVYHISVVRDVEDNFIRSAVARFPFETYAVVFGTRRGRRIRILDLWLPEDQPKLTFGTPTMFSCDRWMKTAQDIAESDGLQIVGDVHSHPFRLRRGERTITDTGPSACDIQDSSGRSMVMGILTLSGRSRGTQYVVDVQPLRWWPPIPAVKVTHTRRKRHAYVRNRRSPGR